MIINLILRKNLYVQFEKILMYSYSKYSYGTAKHARVSAKKKIQNAQLE